MCRMYKCSNSCFMVQLLVKFRFFIEELWERKSLQILYECSRHKSPKLISAASSMLSMSFRPKLVSLKSSVGMTKLLFIIPTVNRNVVVCINVPIHVLWCSCWWNLDFSLKSYGKESLYKYCMNVHDGRIMRSWSVRSLKWIGEGVLNLQRDIRKIAYNLMNKVP
jgi:hypothetical protein